MRRRLFGIAIIGWSACGPRPTSPQQHRGGDRDHDQIADISDQCRDEPEDRDNFADADGCADPDNDQDRIADALDRCPDAAELYNGYEDADGCPDRGCAHANEMPACITERLFFSRGKESPLAQTQHVAERAARELLESKADIELVTIRGFRSPDETKSLATRRAAAVRDLLVRRGIEGTRLAIEEGRITPGEGHDVQRRVELEITKQRVAAADADEIVCTPMGPRFVKLGEAEKRVRCQ